MLELRTRQVVLSLSAKTLKIQTDEGLSAGLGLRPPKISSNLIKSYNSTRGSSLT